jgi:hypothetical protein
LCSTLEGGMRVDRDFIERRDESFILWGVVCPLRASCGSSKTANPLRRFVQPFPR